MNSRARMMLDALNLPSALQQSQQPAQPMRYAEGGMVGLPSLADLARPDFNWSSLNSFAPAPSSFTPMTQNVPMFVADSPAYGSMGTDVYDWKAPTAAAAPQPYSTVNQPTAITRNRRVPTQTAVVDVQMPTYETPAPVVPTPEYIPTMPGTGGQPVQEAPYTPPPVEAPYTPPPAPVSEPVFTPVAQPLGPTPEEVRRSEAAAELEAFNKRQAELAEQKRIADEAEAKRIADEKAKTPAPKELTLDMYRDYAGTPYASAYYMNLKNAQRLQAAGIYPEIAATQFAAARRYSDLMDKGEYGSDEGNTWYAGDSGD